MHQRWYFRRRRPPARLLATTLGILLALPFLVSQPAAAQRYTLREIPAPTPELTSTAEVINNRGDVAGRRGGDFVYLLKDGRFYDAAYYPRSGGGIWPYEESVVGAINDLGIVAGTWTQQPDEYDWSLFRWDGTGPLGLVGRWMNYLHVTAINNRGQMVGSYRRNYYPVGDPLRYSSRPFLFDNGAFVDLDGLPGPAPFHQGMAVDINDWGDVITRETDLNPLRSPRNTLIRHGRRTDLGSFFPWRINNLGVIVGSLNGRIALWANGSVRYVSGLGFPEGTSAINDLGTIVGSTYFPGQGSRAWVYTALGGLRLLEELVVAPGWVLERANDVNDRGQIVGTGNHHGRQRGFVLTPTRWGW